MLVAIDQSPPCCLVDGAGGHGVIDRLCKGTDPGLPETIAPSAAPEVVPVEGTTVVAHPTYPLVI